MIRSGSILLISIVGVLLLSSCSRGVVKTVDSSVEYKSAQSLPALKKDRPSNQTAASSQNNQQSVISAEVVKGKDDASRLRVNSNIEAAWDYLDGRLKAVNETVYNRNKSAGFFSVGCGDIADIPEFDKKRGWRILKRKKKTTVTEYCLLQVTSSRRKSTSFTFLNRYGKVISGSHVDDLFGRILNN